MSVIEVEARIRAEAKTLHRPYLRALAMIAVAFGLSACTAQRSKSFDRPILSSVGQNHNMEKSHHRSASSMSQIEEDRWFEQATYGEAP